MVWWSEFLATDPEVREWEMRMEWENKNFVAIDGNHNENLQICYSFVLWTSLNDHWKICKKNHTMPAEVQCEQIIRS
jgi:hypothetical protein